MASPDRLSAPIDALRAAGVLTEAEQACRSALAKDPNSAPLLHRLGTVLGAQARAEEAIASLRAATEADPSRADYFATLAIALGDLKRSEESLAACDRALALDGELVEVELCRAIALRRLLRLEESAEAFRRVAERRPASADVHAGLAQVLGRAGRFGEAENAARRALALAPGHVPAVRQLSSALLFQGRAAEAIEALESAWAHAPGDADIELNLGLALLGCGRYSEGWGHYEARLASTQEKHNMGSLSYPSPRWRGEALAGRTLLLHCEQGLGDTLQFARFIPDLEGLGARVVVRANARLCELLQRCFPHAIVASLGDPAPACDYWSPMLSLGGLLSVTPEKLPGNYPYLSADPRRRERWRGRLPSPAEALRVGIAWAGSPTNMLDEQRSIGVEALAPLASVPGVTLFSLQHGPRSAQAADCGFDIFTPGDAITPFEELAAFIAELDVVVTVDTAVAHLAGAVGTRCWILLSGNPDWRWLLERTDSPWYPSVRLFRQREVGDWLAPIEEAAQALLELARSGG